MSGALPITTASMSDQSIEASSRALFAASRTSPAIETSVLADVHCVCPVPTTAQSSPIKYHSPRPRYLETTVPEHRAHSVHLAHSADLPEHISSSAGDMVPTSRERALDAQSRP